MNLALVCHLVLTTVLAQAAAPTARVRDEARASLDLEAGEGEGGGKVSLRSQIFDVLAWTDGQGRSRTLLLRQQTDLVRHLDSDGFERAEVTLDVSELVGRSRQPRFVLRERGSRGTLDEHNRLFVVSTLACCEETSAHAVYSLESGKRLFFTGGERAPFLLTADWGDGVPHLLGVHVAGSARDAEVYGKTPAPTNKRRVLISYARASRPSSHVLLLLEDPTTRVTAVDWAPSDGQTRRMQLTITGVGTLVIPVERTGPVLDRATLPAGVSVISPATRRAR